MRQRTRTGAGGGAATLVVAAVALGTAVAGTAHAAGIAAKNSVASRSIKNGQVGTVDLGRSAVTSAKVADRGVRTSDIAAGAVGRAHLAEIEQYVGEVDRVDADSVANGGNHGVADATAMCPEGEVPIGGGAFWIKVAASAVPDENVYVQASHPVPGGWHAKGIVDAGSAAGSVRLRAYVYCIGAKRPGDH